MRLLTLHLPIGWVNIPNDIKNGKVYVLHNNKLVFEQHGILQIQVAFEQKDFMVEYLRAACRNARHQSAGGTAGQLYAVTTVAAGFTTFFPHWCKCLQFGCQLLGHTLFSFVFDDIGFVCQLACRPQSMLKHVYTTLHYLHSVKSCCLALRSNECKVWGEITGIQIACVCTLRNKGITWCHLLGSIGASAKPMSHSLEPGSTANGKLLKLLSG